MGEVFKRKGKRVRTQTVTNHPKEKGGKLDPPLTRNAKKLPNLKWEGGGLRHARLTKGKKVKGLPLSVTTIGKKWGKKNEGGEPQQGVKNQYWSAKLAQSGGLTGKQGGPNTPTTGP